MTLKLFVADDSATIQKIIGLAFSGEDAAIESVTNGDSALDRIRDFKPDVVLADVYMPGCNGYEICEHIKQDPQLMHTPVVLLVGTFEPYDESEASRVKCDGYLTKPFDTTELIQTVHTLMGKTGMAQKGDTPVEKPGTPGPRGLVSPQAWTSFLGSDSVLDLFNRETLVAAEGNPPAGDWERETSKTVLDFKPAIPAMTAQALSEEVIDSIVDRVVRRMSAEVIREVAWEVVPELSEVIIRRSIEEKNKSCLDEPVPKIDAFRAARPSGSGSGN